MKYYSRAVIRDESVDEKLNEKQKVTMGPKTDFGWEVYPRSKDEKINDQQNHEINWRQKKNCIRDQYNSTC